MSDTGAGHKRRETGPDPLVERLRRPGWRQTVVIETGGKPDTLDHGHLQFSDSLERRRCRARFGRGAQRRVKRGRKTGGIPARQGRTAKFGRDGLLVDLDRRKYDVRGASGFLRLPGDPLKGGQDDRLARRRIRKPTGRYMRDRVSLFALGFLEGMVTLHVCRLAVRMRLFRPVGHRAGESLFQRCVWSRGFRHPRMRASGLLVLHYPQEYLVQRTASPLCKFGAVQAGRFLRRGIGLLGQLLQLCRREAEVLGKSKDVLAQAEDQNVVFHERANRAAAKGAARRQLRRAVLFSGSEDSRLASIVVGAYNPAHSTYEVSRGQFTVRATLSGRGKDLQLEQRGSRSH